MKSGLARACVVPLCLFSLSAIGACRVDRGGTGSPWVARDPDVERTDAVAGRADKPATAVDDGSVAGDGNEAGADEGPGALDQRIGDASDASDGRFGADGLAVDLRPDYPPVPEMLPAGVNLQKGLLLYLRLDDGAGSKMAQDQSGQKNAVVLRDADVKAAWVEGRFDGALNTSPNGVGGWLRVENAPSLNQISAGFTVGAWVNRTAKAEGVVLARRSSAAAGGFIYIFQVTSAGHPRVQVHSGNGYHADLEGLAVIPTDRWVHIGATYDSLNVKVYVDGDLSATAPFTLGIGPEISPVLVGGSQNSALDTASSRFQGLLDEVTLYDHALGPLAMASLAIGFRPTPR